jgi:sialic acid synthase SpsE
MKFQLDGKWVGFDSPVYLIAETGTTANGNLETAKKLIDQVKAAGFDAIKFQNISPRDYMSDRNVTYKYMTASGPQEKNMFEMLEPLVFSKEAWKEIATYARERQITCFATVNWLGGVEMMQELGAPAFKVASWDLNYPDLMARMFRSGKPVFIDLGPVGPAEVFGIRKLARECGNDKVIFLYDFHTSSPEEMHMRAIPYLEEALGEPVGFSSPGKEWDLDLLSLGLGARVLEKRVTLNDKDSGHHHVAALCGSEVEAWVKTIRRAEASLGERKLIPSTADLNDSKKYFRGVTVLKKIRQGEAFSPENLGAKRPQKGIDPRFLDVLWGKKAAADLEPDTQINWEQVDLRK